MPISALSPFHPGWSIKARVIDKSPVKTWSNARSQGQLFSMTLVDDQNDAIRATVFQEGVTKFYEMVENEKVYVFSKGNVKNANKKFTTLSNDYELSFDQNAEIVPAHDDQSIGRNKFTLVPIANLATKEKNTNVDLCVVVMEVGELGSILTKPKDPTKGPENLRKRVVTIADQSEAQVELTLWQESAESFRSVPGDVIVCKNVRISDWSGISVSMSQQGSIIEHPDIDQAKALRHWVAARGSLTGIPSLTVKGLGAGTGYSDERRPFSTIRDLSLGMRDDGKPDYLTVRATLTHIKPENMWYPACPTCSKKVIPVSDHGGLYRCDKCEKNTEASFRYILSLTAMDHTGSSWLTAFQEVAEAILGCTAQEAAAAQEANPNSNTELCRRVCFRPFVMRLRVREEFVQDEKRMKCTVLSAKAVNWQTESEVLLQEINRYHALAA